MKGRGLVNSSPALGNGVGIPVDGLLTTETAAIEELWKAATALHGDEYDTAKILIYFMWIRYFHRKDSKIVDNFNNGKYTCNEFVVAVCRGTLSDFQNMDYSYTPEALYKYFYGEPSK